MNYANLSGFIFIEDYQCKSFEKEFTELMEKYKSKNIPNSCYNIKFNKAWELDNNYKPGQLYKINVCKIETYLLILSIVNGFVVGAMLPESAMKRFKQFKKSVVDDVIIPHIIFAKLDEENHLLYNMNRRITTFEDTKPNYQPIDHMLEYYEDINCNKLEYILSQLKHITTGTNE